MYKLIFDKDAIAFLSKCEKEVAKRIWNKLIISKSNPHRFFKRLVGRRDYKLRVGNYRIIADIDDNEKRIEITLIGHRKNIYKQ